jgi:serine/threonine protein kinase
MNMHQRPKLEKYPGAELLPGYRLIQLLGRGGFGEVWKVEAPGRLHKAMKFVAGGSDQFRQELAAFEQVRSIRHPYLLSLERVELIEGELVMVMELADCQIFDRYKACESEGLPGIPRAELLGYLDEAAEALDTMSTRYGLQHLDVKPENLFLFAGHMKVGDYGLVRSRRRFENPEESPHGFTPRYAAPEVLTGRVDPRSDQYSLALVYVELLTGRFPYSGTTAGSLLSQHLNSPPDLSALPRGDRAAVGRALSKTPEDRFPSCSAFIRVLAAAADDPVEDFPLPDVTPAPVALLDYRAGGETVSNRGAMAAEAKGPVENPPKATDTPLPVAQSASTRIGRKRQSSADATPPPKPLALPSVLSLDQLNGMPEHAARKATMRRSEMIEELVRTAAFQMPGVRGGEALPDGAETCWFISTIPGSLIPFKLALVAERFGLTLAEPDPSRVTLTWRPPPLPVKGSRDGPPKPRGGLDIIIHRPYPPSADYFAVGTAAHDAPANARDVLRESLDQIRTVLQNVDERRKFPRFPTEFPILAYPHYSDGMVGQPISGTCRDVSEGGVRFVTGEPLRTERAYLVFQEPASLAENAMLVHLLRSTPNTGSPGTVTVARFRTDR